MLGQSDRRASVDARVKKRSLGPGEVDLVQKITESGRHEVIQGRAE
jgi:hypothetical protein